MIQFILVDSQEQIRCLHGGDILTFTHEGLSINSKRYECPLRFKDDYYGGTVVDIFPIWSDITRPSRDGVIAIVKLLSALLPLTIEPVLDQGDDPANFTMTFRIAN